MFLELAHASLSWFSVHTKLFRTRTFAKISLRITHLQPGRRRIKAKQGWYCSRSSTPTTILLLLLPLRFISSPEHYIMQQRKGVPAGRPSGTDGSDFSYRMVVDSRYTKVAKGKSHLKALFALQTVSEVIGSLLLWVSASQGPELSRFAVLSVWIGWISLIIGEIGRRRSQVNLLRAYTFISFIATAFSVISMVRNDALLKVIHSKNVEALTNYELLKVVHLLFGVVLQIFVFVIVPPLVRNMSPPKRSQ